VSEEEYYDWFLAMGFTRTGQGTNLTEEWVNDAGTYIMVPKPAGLTPRDRLSVIERMRRTLGFGHPSGGGGVH
jgi:hypothetical protein